MKESARCAAWLLAALLLLTAAGALAQPIPEEGCYTIGVSSNASMFRVVRCVLDVGDGELHAVLTLSGQGYGYLYPGTAEEAAAAPRETWIPYGEDSEGRTVGYYSPTGLVPGARAAKKFHDQHIDVDPAMFEPRKREEVE